MKTVMLLLLGVAIGWAASHIIPASGSQASLHQRFSIEARSLLVDSIIDALESIEEGDTETARIILASAVNAQIVTVRKMKASSGEERDRAEAWAERMLERNRQLNLKVDY